VVEAGVVGRSDPSLRAVEEPLCRRAQLSRDLDTERDELRAVLEVMMVFQAVPPAPTEFLKSSASFASFLV
jgi:hypothetical protein